MIRRRSRHREAKESCRFPPFVKSVLQTLSASSISFQRSSIRSPYCACHVLSHIVLPGSRPYSCDSPHTMVYACGERASVGPQAPCGS